MGDYALTELNHVEVMKGIEFFKNFSRPDLEIISPISYIKEFKVGDILIKQNTKNGTIYFNLSGEVDVFIDEGFVMCFNDSGHVFGEMSFVNQTVASATVMAKSDARFLCINIEEIYKLDKSYHISLQRSIYQSCAELLANKLRATNELAKHYMNNQKKAS